MALQIDIPPTSSESTPQSDDEIDSPLFTDSPSVSQNILPEVLIPAMDDQKAAFATAPPIPGLFFDPSLLIPPDISHDAITHCLSAYFTNNNANQAMLFGRSPDAEQHHNPSSPSPYPIRNASSGGLPPILLSLLETVANILRPSISADLFSILFPEKPTLARQVIINLYRVGEGISSHVDLLRRFGDGIIGVSLGSSCVMRFDSMDKVGGSCEDRSVGDEVVGDSLPEQLRNTMSRDSQRKRWDLFLPERSILVLSGDARYRWKHGIEKLERDFVKVDDVEGDDRGQWVNRATRLSVTFRWLLPGADVVGEATSN